MKTAINKQETEFIPYENAQGTSLPVNLSSMNVEQSKEQDLCPYDPRSAVDKRLLRVAAYIRISTDSDNQEDSYETQKTYFMEFLTGNPTWISAGIYSDYGISGTSKEYRIGFHRLLRHCEEGRIDRIVTKSISRFARNTRDFLKALEILKSNHVTIAFEKEHLDTAIIQNDLLFTTFGAIAQEESRSISENIRWGIQKRYPRGEARNICIYGYRYAEGEDAVQKTEGGYIFRNIRVIEEEAAVVRRIYQEIADGKSYISVARKLNFEHIPMPESALDQKRRNMSETPGGILKPELTEGWTARHISQIIQLERYAGDVLLQKTYKPDYKSHKVVKNEGELEQYYVANHHPAIISRELFQNVQKVRHFNSLRYGSNRKKKSYPFSKRLVCTHCGRFYHTRNRKKRPIWFCSSTAQNNGMNICHAEKIYEEQIIRACHKAIIDRFRIIDDTLQNTLGQLEPFNGIYTTVDLNFKAGSKDVIKDLLQKMKQIQRADNIEYDRIFLKSKISEILDKIETKKQKLEILKAKREIGQIRLTVLKENQNQKELDDLDRQITAVQLELGESIAAQQKLKGQLDDMEKYWLELEADYEWRKKAIAWMSSLPEGQTGIIEFLNGLTDKYIKAFIHTIEIESPVRYRIRWFDDIWSEVEMHSNAE